MEPKVRRSSDRGPRGYTPTPYLCGSPVRSVLQVEDVDPAVLGDWLDLDLTLGALVLAGASSDGHRVRCQVAKVDQRLGGDLPTAQRERRDALRLLARLRRTDHPNRERDQRNCRTTHTQPPAHGPSHAPPPSSPWVSLVGAGNPVARASRCCAEMVLLHARTEAAGPAAGADAGCLKGRLQPEIVISWSLGGVPPVARRSCVLEAKKPSAPL
jgi:hypothetical protein